MDDLISRKALLQRIKNSTAEKAVKVLAQVLVNTAPAVDAVEVVRREDCDYWDEEFTAGRASLGNLVCVCKEWSDVEGGRYCYTRPNEFCSRGERKENATD